MTSVHLPIDRYDAKDERLCIAEESDVCVLCVQKAPPYKQACAYGSYENELRHLIHLLKYDKVLPAANVLGEMLSVAILAMLPRLIGSPNLVIPVPLHPKKTRERGFNQAEVIAKAALKRGVFDRKLELSNSVLKRKRITESQIGLSDKQRRANLGGAFAVTSPHKVMGRDILLVDDVFTTGTTIAECARVLRRAGASTVWVATVARTLKRNGRESHGAESVYAAAG